MSEIIPPIGSLIERFSPFELDSWLTSPGRYNPLAVFGGPGSGKSTLVGGLTAFYDFWHGIPQIILDPTGGTIKSFIHRLNQIGPNFEKCWWQRYRQPVPPAWIHYIDAVLAQLTQRLIYVDMSGKAAFPLYYRLAEDESLFDMSQRFLEVIRRWDPALEQASIEGMNAAVKVGTYAGMLLSALGLQITEAEDLIRHPEQWQGRFEEALAAYPEVWPAVQFFREFIKAKPEIRVRRTESFLTKILAFSADPTMALMFGSGARSVNAEQVVHQKQTVLMDFSKVHNRERRRLLMLWGMSETITYAKYRGPAGRAAPLAIVIDEITQLLSHQSNGQSIMAADIEELVSVIARNYGIYLTLMGQRISAVDEQIQGALLQGNVLMGVVGHTEDAEVLGRHFFRFDPYWVKKQTPVYMAFSSEPYYDPVPYKMYNSIFYLNHVSTRTTPKIIDWVTEDFSKADQLELFMQALKDLPKYTFLAHASAVEGQRAAALQRLNISSFAAGFYAQDSPVAEACRRLAKRHEQTIAAFSQPGSLVRNAPKPLQPSRQPATMKETYAQPHVSPTRVVSDPDPASGDPTPDPTAAASTPSPASTDFWEAPEETPADAESQ